MFVSSSMLIPARQRAILTLLPLPGNGIRDVPEWIEPAKLCQRSLPLLQHLRRCDEWRARLLRRACSARHRLECCFDPHLSLTQLLRQWEVESTVGVSFQDRGDRAHRTKLPTSGAKGKRVRK